jgi:hypothetical protein
MIAAAARFPKEVPAVGAPDRAGITESLGRHQSELHDLKSRQDAGRPAIPKPNMLRTAGRLLHSHGVWAPFCV